MCVCVCACVYVLVCMYGCVPVSVCERVVNNNVRRTEYHTQGRMWSMCVIIGTPYEKWYARTKNDTALQTVRCSTVFGFSCGNAGKTVRRTFHVVRSVKVRFQNGRRTVSKGTRYAFWYAVRFSVAIVVPFIAAYKVYKSYTCSIFGMGGCFWYACTVFRMRPFNGTLYCISYACTIFRLASVFGTHTVFGT